MSQNGYIYFISDPATSFLKIGFSTNPHRRLRELNKEPTLLPRPLSFRLITAFEGTMREEHRLHQLFAAKRKRGEWFELCHWRYMDILYAFEHRKRLHPFDWEIPDEPVSDPWENLGYRKNCECEDCNPFMDIGGLQ